MFRAKNGVHPLLSRTAVCLALAFSAIGTGCTETTGLRSVGTDRPGLLSFWDRSQPPPPDPAGDYYARYMRTARDRADGMAKQSADSPGPARDAGEAEGVTPRGDLVASGKPAGSSPSRAGKTAASAAPVRDDGLRVTLGPPEPLPALSLPAPLASPDTALASNASPSPSERELASNASPSPAKRDRTSPEAVAEPESATDSTPQLAGHGDDGADDREHSDEPVAKPSPKRPVKPASPSGDARAILVQSRDKLESLSTYQVKISRTERVNGRLLPEEQIVLSIRRNPKAVRLEWADGPDQGREVIYSTVVDKGSLFVHMPKSAFPLPTMKVSLDNPLVMKNSRHSIAEAGFDTIIDNLQKAQDGGRKPDLGRLTYRDIEKPPGLDRPSHVFTRRAPSGETWTVFLDMRTMLPCMVVAKDPSGELNERYVYHEVRENPTDLASAGAFEPDQRWGESKGLLSRFARGAGSDSPNNRQSATR